MGPPKSKVSTPVGPELSAIKNLEEKLERMKGVLDDMKNEVRRFSYPNFQSNTTCRNGSNDIPIDEPIPMDDLIVLEGFLDGKRVRVLKDDGCNTNVVSREFFNKNRKNFKWKNCNVEVSHSQKGSVENSSKSIIGATLRIGKHLYKSNWLVANCRYDLLLGMPWHVAHNPCINYDKKIVKVGENELKTDAIEQSGLKVLNLSVKKFRKIMKKNDPYVNVFQLVSEKQFETKNGIGVAMGENSNPGLRKILQKFCTVFQEELPPGLPPERDVDHEIQTEEDAKPPHRPMYQLSPVELKAMKDYVGELLDKGKIRPSKSPYGAPLFFVKEKDKPLRAVVDYRGLNRITKKNNAPLPRSDEMFDMFGDAAVFSKMDLKTGFHQIRVKPEDVEKTAFNTKYGQFEYLVMPMGLCNAPATFQSLMNRIFYDCVDVFMVVYMDDLLIFSKDEKSHLEHLNTVLSRLKDHKLYVSPKKCDFMKSEISFLGMIVGKGGIKVDPKKVEVLKNWPKPNSLTDVRSFMGLLQFFRRFIKDFSKLSAPLTNLTKKGEGILKWDIKCDEAFESLKKAITSAPILVSPDWKKPFRGHIDASNTSVGGTLTQLDDCGKDKVIAFFSKKLNPAELNYTTNDKELLGLIYFLQRFRCYLEGSNFEIFTDNQVLKSFFTKPKLSRREARWLETLGIFGIFPITLKPGKIHVLGDTLSRAPHASMNALEVLNVDLEDVIDGYEDDKFYGSVLKLLKGEEISDEIMRRKILKIKPLFHLNERKLLYCGKLCVPRKAIPTILQLAHDAKTAGHFGYLKTLSRLKNYHWKHKSRDVKNYIQGCLVCQQKKDYLGKKLTDPTSLEVPERRWGSLASDFIVKLPKTKNGFDSITTYVDRLSRRVHFIPSKDSDTAVDVANAFFSNLFKLHGMPDSIVSDRDPKFTSKFWKRLMELCGVKLKMSSSRHPQTDGSSEIMNRMVENYIRCYCNYHQNDWDELLPGAEFAYNSAVSDDLGMTPFEADLGWNPKSPLDLMSSSNHLNETVAEFKERLKETLEDAKFAYQLAKADQSARSSLKYKPHSYKPGDELWISKSLFKDAYSKSQVSDKLSAKRFGPFKVLELIGKNAVRLELPDHVKIHEVVNVMHTVPYHKQPVDISGSVVDKPDPVPAVEGTEFVVDKILSHRKRGRGYQFLTLMKGDPTHEAEWQPMRDFIDKDGTMNENFLSYIKGQGILNGLYEGSVVEGDNRWEAGTV